MPARAGVLSCKHATGSITKLRPIGQSRAATLEIVGPKRPGIHSTSPCMCCSPADAARNSQTKLERCLNELSPRRLHRHQLRHLTTRTMLTLHQLKLAVVKSCPIPWSTGFDAPKANEPALDPFFVPVGSDTFCKGLRTLGSDWVGFVPKNGFGGISAAAMLVDTPFKRGFKPIEKVVPRGGFEPPTPAFSVPCSTRLSYLGLRTLIICTKPYSVNQTVAPRTAKSG